MLSQLVDNYAAYEYALASSQLFLAMLGMGLLLTPEDFLRELSRPKGVVIGIVFQWVLVPLLAALLGFALTLPAGIAVGLVLIAAVPGGTMSNILTLFGRGNITLSISLTSITTVASLATTPLLLGLLLAQYLPDDFSMPTLRIARDITVTLIFPLLFGMFLKTRMTTYYAAQIAKWLIRLSVLMVVLMAVGASGAGRLDPQAYGVLGVVALLALFFCVQLVGVLVCKLSGLTSKDQLAIVVEACFRNISLAVAIKAIVFPAVQGELDPVGDAALFAIMLYGGISLFMTLIPVALHRRKTAPQT